MAVDSRYNLVPLPYMVSTPPDDWKSLRSWYEDELRKISATLTQLAEGQPQVADAPPQKPRRGTIRYAIAPWNPLGNGAEGWVWWNGTAWTAL